MKKTQKKILINAIQLFNKRGVGNVRLQDIAKKAGISAGNLSYHYKTKKDLMEAVLKYMTEELKATKNANMTFLEQDDYISLIKTYLRFQIGHRFFYRDILEIIRLCPEIKSAYESQIHRVVNYNKTLLFLMV
ncbi:MAG: TetR/AcrR family transcriptional regulator, partial [Chitinophagales bacterium]